MCNEYKNKKNAKLQQSHFKETKCSGKSLNHLNVLVLFTLHNVKYIWVSILHKYKILRVNATKKIFYC